MSSSENEAWKWFKMSSYTLSDMNWRISIDSILLFVKSLKTAHCHAKALNQIYKTDKTQSCHSVWFTKHHSVHISLVKAMSQIINAEWDLVEDNVWTATQLTDLQSINKILFIITQFVSGCALQPLLLIIIHAQTVLMSHRDALRNYIVSCKHKCET